MTHAKIVTVASLVLALTVGPIAGSASADPGDGASGRILKEERITLGPRDDSQRPDTISPAADTLTDLGGGVTATSTAGMQWGSNIFGEDVSGLTRSSTNVAISEIHTHGALVQHGDSNAPNCYEGDVKWSPSITNFNTNLADSGWGPFFSGFHDCWVMATGHYYIHNLNRTDVVGPDISKRF